MALMDHIFLCNKKNLRTYRPLILGDAEILGWIHQDRVELLAAYPDIFSLSRIAVILNPELATPQARTEALAAVAQDLVDRGHIKSLNGEMFACKHRWHAQEHFLLDRRAVPFFGLKAYGVHANGWVRHPDGPKLWIGRRARDKAVAPGQYDNMVAGGQPAGLSLRENLVKEAAEEAAVPRALALTAKAVSTITYCMEQPAGLKPDTLFCYDLEVPEDFVPRNTDGEVESFSLWSATDAIEALRDGQEFKFNVALVIIDFGIRHGLIDPDNEPDIEALIAGLHYPHPH